MIYDNKVIFFLGARKYFDFGVDVDIVVMVLDNAADFDLSATLPSTSLFVRGCYLERYSVVVLFDPEPNPVDDVNEISERPRRLKE